MVLILMQVESWQNFLHRIDYLCMYADSPFITIKTLNAYFSQTFFTVLNCAQLHTLINGVGRPCLFPLKIMLMVKWIRFHQCCRLMEEATGCLNAQSTNHQKVVKNIAIHCNFLQVCNRFPIATNPPPITPTLIQFSQIRNNSCLTVVLNLGLIASQLTLLSTRPLASYFERTKKKHI